MDQKRKEKTTQLAEQLALESGGGSELKHLSSVKKHATRPDGRVRSDTGSIVDEAVAPARPAVQPAAQPRSQLQKCVFCFLATDRDSPLTER